MTVVLLPRTRIIIKVLATVTARCGLQAWKALAWLGLEMSTWKKVLIKTGIYTLYCTLIVWLVLDTFSSIESQGPYDFLFF